MTPEEMQEVHDAVYDKARREYEALTPAREKMERAIKAATKEYEKEEKKYREIAANNHALSEFVQPAPVQEPKPAKKSKQNRCKEQNNAGGCMIRESCEKRTVEDRAAVGCTVPVAEKPVKKQRKVRANVEPCRGTACLECLKQDECEDHDPHAGCAREAEKPEPEDPVPVSPPEQEPVCTPSGAKKNKKVAEEKPAEKNLCDSCCHTSGRGTIYETCPKWAWVNTQPRHPTQSPARVIAEDTEKNGCDHWRIGAITCCTRCGHRDHTELLKPSCPSAPKDGMLSGEQVRKIFMDVRKFGCSGWIPVEEPAATLKDPICYCTPCKIWATCTAKPEGSECKAHRILGEDDPNRCEHGNCTWAGICPHHKPHEFCQQEAAKDYAKTCEDDIDDWSCKETCQAFPFCERAQKCIACDIFKECELKNPGPDCHQKNEAPVTEKKGGCTNCGHHKTKKSFKESCTRLKDLMFKGGEYSAARLMAEVEADGCLGWIPREITKKKPRSKADTPHFCNLCSIRKTCTAKPMTDECTELGGPSGPEKPAKEKRWKKTVEISIKPVDDTMPVLVEIGMKYLTSYNIHSGDFIACAGGSETTKEGVVASILHSLNAWQKEKKLKIPISEMDVTLVDITGDFTIKDFFEPTGKLKKSPSKKEDIQP